MDPFLHYNKISDDIFWLNPQTVIRMNVSLYRRTSKGEKKFFHKEYEYNYGEDKMVTIRRSYDYYLTIENLDKQDKESVMIGVRDYLRFKTLLQTAVGWFTDKKYKGLFGKSKNKMVMVSPIPSAEINGLPNAKSIRCDPIVLEFGETIDNHRPGLRFSYGDSYADIDVDILMGFYYSISELNMLLSAQLMLAYMRPPYNCNRTVIDDGTAASYYRTMNLEKLDKNGEAITGIEGRKVKPLNQKKGLKDLE